MWLAAIAYVLIVLGFVLSPTQWLLNRLTVWLYVLWNYQLGLPGSPSPEVFGFLLNIVLFVPVGLFAVLLLRRHWLVATVLGVAMSAAIELVQLIPALHRMADVSDVISNGLGGLIGALLGTWWRRRKREGRRPA